MSRRNRDVLGSPPFLPSLATDLELIEEPADTGLTDRPLKLAASPLWLVCEISGRGLQTKSGAAMSEEGLLELLDAAGSPRRDLLVFWQSVSSPELLGIRGRLFGPVASKCGSVTSLLLLNLDDNMAFPSSNNSPVRKLLDDMVIG